MTSVNRRRKCRPGLPPGTRTSRPKLAFLHFAGHTSPQAPGETPGLPPGTRTSRPRLAFFRSARHASPHHRARRPGFLRELGRLVRSWRSYTSQATHHPGTGRDVRAPTGNSDVSSEVGVLTLRRPHIPQHRARRPGSHRELGRRIRSWRSYTSQATHHPSTVRDYRAPTGNSDVSSEAGVLTFRRPRITPPPGETPGLQWKALHLRLRHFALASHAPIHYE